MARLALVENEVLGYCEALRHAESRVSRFRRGLSRHVLRAQTRSVSLNSAISCSCPSVIILPNA
jgi:hypothetical protein